MTEKKKQTAGVTLDITALADLYAMLGRLDEAGGLDADPDVDERAVGSCRLVRPFTVALGEDLDTEATFAADGSVTIRENLA